MKRILVFLFCSFLLVPVAGFGDLPEFYNQIIDLTAGQEEQNAGLSGFPILLIPIGGKRQAMGTASTGFVEGVGFLEANPAGSVGLDSAEFALAHREWNAGGAIDSIAAAVGIGPVGFGIGGKFFYTPFTAYDDSGNSVGSGYFSEYLGVLNASVRIVELPRFSFDVGGSAKLVGRIVQESIEPDQSDYGFPIDLGLLVKTRFADFSRSSRKNIGIGLVLRDAGQLSRNFGAPLPTAVAAGVAYSPVLPFLVTADFTLPISLYPESFPAELYWYAVGLDIRVTNFLSIQTGASLKAENFRFGFGIFLDFGAISVAAAYSTDIVSGFNPLNTMSVMTSFKLDTSSENTE